MFQQTHLNARKAANQQTQAQNRASPTKQTKNNKHNQTNTKQRKNQRSRSVVVNHPNWKFGHHSSIKHD